VKEMKKSACVAFRGSRIHLRELAEAILAAQEPTAILFPVPISAKCEPKVIEDFRDLVRMAVRCRWLSASEILEILLQQIIEVMNRKKLPPDDADNLALAIQIGFGTAVLILESASVDQFLGRSAALLTESLNKPRTRKLSSHRAAATERFLTTNQAARSKL
jgi:hypothetical protein